MSLSAGARESVAAVHASGRPFVKMHGLRNHFFIVDAREVPYRPGRDEIVRLCDPAIGIGGDQLVVIEPSRESRAAACVRFWNVDGREVEACGNATRCVAWLLLEEQSIDAVFLETRAGLLECRRAGPWRVSASMGRIRTGWREIPLAEARDTVHLDVVAKGPLGQAVALNIGNPHVVFFVDDLDAVDVAALAPPIQRDPLFPEQVNVGVAEMRSYERLRLVVYERGAGLTQACGSGACVAHFAALSRGLTDARRMTVELPGGELDIEILADGSAVMTGPVAFCFSGFLPE